MSEINNEAEKTYSTGELAALCGTSVRTVNITTKKAPTTIRANRRR